MRIRNRDALRANSPRIILVENDPADPNRVIATDENRNCANMTVRSFRALCTLAPGAIVLSDRIGTS